MKNIAIACTITFMFLNVLSAHGQALSGDKWTEAKNSKSAEIYYTYNTTNGFATKSANNKLEGLCAYIWDDFVDYVEQKYQMTVNDKFSYQADNSDFVQFYETIKKSEGGVFGLGGITITDERKKEVDFSPSFFSNVSVLITASSVPELTDKANIAEQFSGMTFLALKGTTHEERAKEMQQTIFPGMKIETFNSYDECYEKIGNSDKYFSYVDFTQYIDATRTIKNVKRHPKVDEIGEEFGFIMPKGSDWKPIMDEFFMKDGGYTNSSQYRKHVDKSLGSLVVNMINYINKQAE